MAAYTGTFVTNFVSISGFTLTAGTHQNEVQCKSVFENHLIIQDA